VRLCAFVCVYVWYVYVFCVCHCVCVCVYVLVLVCAIVHASEYFAHFTATCIYTLIAYKNMRGRNEMSPCLLCHIKIHNVIRTTAGFSHKQVVCPVSSIDLSICIKSRSDSVRAVVSQCQGCSVTVSGLQCHSVRAIRLETKMNTIKNHPCTDCIEPHKHTAESSCFNNKLQ